MLSQSSRRALPQVIQLAASSGRNSARASCLAAIEHVALILGDDEGEAGDLAGEVADFDAAEVGERDVGAALGFAAAAVDLRLDLAHFLVGDDEEIAGAAGGIEDADAGDALAQVQQLAGIVPRFLQLGRAGRRGRAGSAP